LKSKNEIYLICFNDIFRCEFASRNLNGCSTGQYYTQIEPAPAIPGPQLSTGMRFRKTREYVKNI